MADSLNLVGGNADTGPDPLSGHRIGKRETHMIFVKILMVGVAIVAFMAFAQQRHLAQKAGLTGSCWTVEAPPNGTGAWYACKQGVLTSFPSLESEGCTSIGLVNHDEVWQCTAPVVSMPGY